MSIQIIMAMPRPRFNVRKIQICCNNSPIFNFGWGANDVEGHNIAAELLWIWSLSRHAVRGTPRWNMNAICTVQKKRRTLEANIKRLEIHLLLFLRLLLPVWGWKLAVTLSTESRQMRKWIDIGEVGTKDEFHINYSEVKPLYWCCSIAKKRLHRFV